MLGEITHFTFAWDATRKWPISLKQSYRKWMNIQVENRDISALRYKWIINVRSSNSLLIFTIHVSYTYFLHTFHLSHWNQNKQTSKSCRNIICQFDTWIRWTNSQAPSLLSWRHHRPWFGRAKDSKMARKLEFRGCLFFDLKVKLNLYKLFKTSVLLVCSRIILDFLLGLYKLEISLGKTWVPKNWKLSTEIVGYTSQTCHNQPKRARFRYKGLLFRSLPGEDKDDLLYIRSICICKIHRMHTSLNG